jgi:hypothetical protein
VTYCKENSRMYFFQVGVSDVRRTEFTNIFCEKKMSKII